MTEPLRRYSTPNQMEQEVLEDRNCDGKMVLFKTREYLGLRIGRKPPSTETNGQNFSRGPGPTKGCRANDDDDDDDDDDDETGGNPDKIFPWNVLSVMFGKPIMPEFGSQDFWGVSAFGDGIEKSQSARVLRSNTRARQGNILPVNHLASFTCITLPGIRVPIF
jgi:hypothetical protein